MSSCQTHKLYAFLHPHTHLLALQIQTIMNILCCVCVRACVRAMITFSCAPWNITIIIVYVVVYIRITTTRWWHNLLLIVRDVNVFSVCNAQHRTLIQNPLKRKTESLHIFFVSEHCEYLPTCSGFGGVRRVCKIRIMK